MKKIKKIILAMVLCISANAQNNLVPNYSFESANTATGSVNCDNIVQSNGQIFVNGGTSLNQMIGIDSWQNVSGNNNTELKQVGWFDLSTQNCLVFYNELFELSSITTGGGDPFRCTPMPIVDKLNINRCICIRRIEASGIGNSKPNKGEIAVNIKETLEENIPYFFRLKFISTKSKFSDPVDINCLLKIRFSDVNDFDGDNNNSWEAVSITRSYPDPNVNPKNCEWEQFETTFTVPAGKTNSKRMFIKAESGTFFIDDVEVYKKCPSMLYLSNRTINSYNVNDNYRYTASDIIKAGYDVGADEIGNFIIKNSNTYDLRTINFKANNNIELLPGFEVDGKNLAFTAAIEPCTSSNRFGISNNVEGTNQISAGDNLPLQTIVIDNKIISTESIREETIKVTPNPAFETLRISLPMNENAEVTFTDLLGKVVINEKVNTGGKEFNIAHLPKGIYFVTAKTASKKYVCKLLKE